MRTYLQILAVCLLSIIGVDASAQTFVDTSAQNKKVVIEQFTGGKSSFDAAGHKVVDDIKSSYPDSVTIINVHTGFYATPGAFSSYNLPEYRTAFGTALQNLAGVIGFPQASVNRSEFTSFTTPGSTALNRNHYDTTAKVVMSQTAPLNIAIRNSYNSQAQKLSIEVEVYFTDTVTDSLFLNVGIKQNNVIGPQNGPTSHYPAKYGANIGIYEHNNMLRALITGQWGEYLDSISYGNGTFWSKTYTWNVPDSIGDVPVIVEDLDVFAFVTEKKEPIITGVSTPAVSGMVGVYTIGGTSPDFTTIGQAVDSLEALGVGGPVTFHIRSGTYNEQIEIDSIHGASATNTITFQKDPAASTKPILQFSGSGVKPYTVLLDGTDYTTFKNLNVRCTGTAYGQGFLIKGYTNKLTIDSCDINGLYGSNSYSTAIYFQGAGGGFSDSATVSNCSIDSCYSGIFFSGTAGGKEVKGNRILNNTCTNFRRYGFEFKLQEDFECSGNALGGAVNSLQQVGIDLASLGANCSILSNSVVNNTTATSGGVYLVNCTGTSSKKITVANNTYRNPKATSNSESGMFLMSSSHVDLYFNTVSINTSSTTSGIALYLNSGNSNISIKNNILSNSGGGVAIYLQSTPSAFVSDYNNLYTSGSHIAYRLGTNLTDLSTWQSLAAKDSNSVSIDPLFIASDTLKPNNGFLNNLGITISGIAIDILDSARNATTPDIGAYEFTGVRPPLAGIYTIGGSAPDYPTVDSAVSDLVSRGVMDTVNFQIRPGTYDAQYKISPFSGMGNGNDVTFQRDPDSTGTVTLKASSAGTASANYILWLDSVSNLTFSNLRFDTNSVNNNRQVYISGVSDSITIDSCYFNGRADLAIETKADSSSPLNYFILSNSTISKTRGSGISLGYGRNNSIINNKIIGFGLIGGFGVYIPSIAGKWTNDSLQIIGNYIKSNETYQVSSQKLYGISHNGGRYGSISNNEIYIKGAGKRLVYGIEGQLRHKIVTNNVVSVTGKVTQQGYAVSSPYVSQTDVYYNTFYLNVTDTGGASTTHATFAGGSTGVGNNVKNNIFVNEGGGNALVLNTGSTNSDYNNIYSPNQSLSAWQNANTGYDVNSDSLNPFFACDTALIPRITQLENAGTAIVGFTTDIDGRTRNATTPSVGAYEYTYKCYGLSGSYTIGGTTPDFVTIAEAVDELNCKGICDDVTFNIRQGTYTDSLILNHWNDPSDTNWVTFQPDPTNTAEVVLSGTVLQGSQLWGINGSERLIIKGIKFTGTPSATGIVDDKSLLAFTSATKHVIIDSCEFDGGLPHIVSFKLFGATSAVSPIDSITLSNNRFKNNSTFAQTVYLTGGVNTQEVIIEDNVFENCKSAVNLNAMSYFKFSGNSISNADAGLRLDGQDGFIIEGNSISTTGRGLVLEFINGTGEKVISNNVMHSSFGPALVTDHVSSGDIDVLHNTFVSAGSSSAVLEYGSTSFGVPTVNFDFTNNIVQHTHNGPVWSIGRNASTFNYTGRNNNYFTNGDTLVWSQDIGYLDLTSFQIAYTSDTNSISINPRFKNDSTFIPRVAELESAGISISGITIDIRDSVRDITNPSIGAYEYTYVCDGLSGVYTIGGTSPDFATIKEAVDSLNYVGVCNDVTFNIRQGTYTEQIFIEDMYSPGDSSEVVFQADPSNTAEVIVRETSLNHYLKGVSSLSFKNMTFTSGIGNERSFEFLKHNEDVSFLNCSFEGVGVYLLSGTDKYLDGLTIDSCEFSELYYGVRIFKGKKGRVLNSSFHCALAVGLGMDSSEVHDNTMRCFVGNTDAIGIGVSGNFHEVYNNDIICQTLNRAYGIHTDFASNVHIYNNSISLLNNNTSATLGYLIGIRHFGSSSISIHHNAIYLQHDSPEAYENYGIRLQSNISDSSLSNNQIVLACHGTGVEYTGSLGNYKSDYNNYVLLEGDTILNDNFTNYYTSLESIRAIGQDSNSVSIDPYFLSDTLLKPYRLKANDKGLYTTEYPVDFDSLTRGVSNTDIGAFQYNPIEYDVVIDSIRFDTLCGGVQSVQVLVKNVADSLVQTLSLGLDIDTSQTGFVRHGSQEFSVNLNKGDSAWVSYTNINLHDSTEYSFALSVDTINGYLDNIPEDNKDTISFWTFPNPVANFVEGAGCANDTISLTADSGSVYYYWEGPSGYLDTGLTVNRSASVGASGMYILSIIDSNFCTDSVHKYIELDTIPQFSLPSDTSFCDGLSYDIQALIDPHLDYRWSNGDSASKITVNTSNSYRLTVTNQYECEAVDSIQVTVFNLPVVTLIPFDSLCQYGDTLHFSEGLPSGGVYSGVNVFDDTLYNPLQSGVFPITYTVVDSNNCENATTQNIVVHKLPNVVMPNMPNVCENKDSLQLTGNSPQGGYFSGDALLDTVQGWFAPNLAIGDSSVISYHYTDQNGCSSRDSSVIHLDSVTTASLSAFPNLCGNERVVLSQGIPFGGSYSGYGMVNDTVFDANTVSPDSSYRIMYTYENAFGCVDTVSGNVFIDSLPIVSFTPEVLTYCVDFGADTLRGGFPLGGRYFGNGVSNDSLFSLDSAGLHEVFYTAMNVNGCWDTASAMIRIYDLPIVNIQLPANDTQLCVDRSTFKLFGGVPSNGQYAGTGVALGRFHPNTAGVGVHSISYTLTDANSCTSSDTAEIVVDSIPVVSVNVPEPDLCVNDPQFAMNWGTPIGGIYTGVGMISDSVFDPASAGVREDVSIRYAYTDGHGCTGVVYDTVNVDSLTPISFGFLSDYCQNALLDTLRTGSILSGDFSFFSQKGAVVNDSVYDPAIAGLGSDVISYRFKNLLGCADTLSQSVEVLAPPIVSWGYTDTVCANGSTQNLNGGLPVGGTYFGSAAIVNGTYQPALAAIGFDTLSYTFSDTLGCADTAIGVVRVDSVPVVQFVSGDTFCLNEGIQNLILASPIGGNYSGSGMTSGTLFDPLLANVGAHTLTYTYTDGNGCSDSKQNVVKVQPLPNASLQSLANVCLDKTAFNLPKGSPLGVNRYFVGTGITDTLLGTFDPVIAGIGSHAIEYIVESSLGCVDTAVQTQVVDSLPIVTLSGFNPVCEDSASFILSGGSPLAGGTGQYNGPGVLGGVFFPNLAQKGTNVITYSFTNQRGCVSSDTAHIIVNRIPTVTPALFSDLCDSEDSVTLSGALPVGGVYSGVQVGNSNRFSPDSVGTFIITYEYTDGNGCSAESYQPITVHSKPFVSLNSIPSTCENGASFRLSGGFPFGGVYSGNAVINGSYVPSIAQSLVDTVWYAFTDLNQCTDSVYRVINLDSATEVSILPFKLVCENDGPIDLNQLVLPAGGVFQGAGVVNSSYLPSVLDTGNNQISYSYTNSFGCKTDTVIDASIHPNPAVEMYSDTAICFGDQAVVGVKQGYSFEWDIGSFDREVLVSPESNTAYQVTVTNGFNCSSVGQIEVEVNPAITLFTNARESECGSNSGVLGVTHIGGQAPFNYLWSTGAKSDKVFDVAAGIYEVSVTDANGCKEVANVAVSDANVQKTLVVNNVEHVSCPGDANGKIILSNANDFESVLWSSGHNDVDSLTGLNGGRYIALGTTSNGCKSAVELLVEESSAIFGAIDSKAEPTCGNADGALSIQVSGGSEPLQFTWNTGQNSKSLSAVPAGAYELYIEDAKQCLDTLIFALGSSQDVNVLIDSIVSPSCGASDGEIFASVFGEVDTVIWSNLDTGHSISGINEGRYWVRAEDTSGCASVRWIDVESKAMAAPVLCLATYDTAKGGYVSIYDTSSIPINAQWHQELLMASTWVTREGTMQNDSIVDTTLTMLGLAHPRRLVALDTCAGKKLFSNTQRPILLHSSKSEDRITLRWNAYEGRNVVQYDIWRQSDLGWEKLDSISPLLTNFVDYAIPEEQRTLKYQVVARFAGSCSNVNTAKSSSNPSVDYGDKYLSENEKVIETKQLHLYPNPNDGSFSLDVSELNGYQGVIEILDQKGVVVYRAQFDENHQGQVAVNLSETTTGIYILKVISHHRMYSEKFVIQH